MQGIKYLRTKIQVDQGVKLQQRSAFVTKCLIGYFEQSDLFDTFLHMLQIVSAHLFSGIEVLSVRIPLFLQLALHLLPKNDLSRL